MKATIIFTEQQAFLREYVEGKETKTETFASLDEAENALFRRGQYEVVSSNQTFESFASLNYKLKG